MKQFRKIGKIRLIIYGAFIGLANLVPGISGGTLAIAFGIYDELIASFRGIISRDRNWRRYPAFLLPLLAGLFASLFLFARAIELLMNTYPVQMLMFFTGLILGAVPFVFRKLDYRTFRIPHFLPGILCFMVPVGLMLARPAERVAITTPTLAELPLIFFSGFVSTATMIIPGVSGTMVLMVIGMYPTYIGALSNLYGLLLLVIALGKLAGVLLVARLLHYLLKHFTRLTYTGIVGLLLGSVVNIWPGFSPGGTALLDTALLAAGFFLALAIQAGPEKPG